MSEERFDPSRHTLDYAAERLKRMGERDYWPRIVKAASDPVDEEDSLDEFLSEEDEFALHSLCPALTETRVREIFREEISRWEKSLGWRMRMQGSSLRGF